MQPYVIVHGAFHGAEVWSAVKSRLERAGHPAIAVTLPGRPGNPLPANQVTLEAYRDCVLSAVNAMAAPVVLVGHSFGGMTISNVAEVAPGRIRTLAYVAAYLPLSGQNARELSAEDADSAWSDRNFLIAADRSTAHVLNEDCVRLFGTDLEPDWQRRLRELLVPEPLLPIRTPVYLTPQRFGGVDKVFIRTSHDNTISPRMQDRMLGRVAVRAVHTIRSSHFPHLSRPDDLTELLLSCPPA